MQQAVIDNNAWLELGTGLVACVIQTSGKAEVYVGSSAPAANAIGFMIQSGVPVEVPQVSALGGGIWVRSEESAGGNVTYAVA